MANRTRSLLRVVSILMVVLALSLSMVSRGQAYSTPVISIDSVVSGVSVTISGINFPAGQTFTVRMGAFGTAAIGGVVVGSRDTASGSSFTATYTIPASLAGAQKIAIRLDSAQGYYSYNWFYNATTTVPVATAARTQAPVYSGYPTIDVTSVVRGNAVTVRASNLPSGQAFTVRMGQFGSAAIGGIVVGETGVLSGDTFTATYTIPVTLASLDKIAIRMDSSQGYFAYNWFYNNTTTAAAPAAVATATTPSAPAYSGYPIITILSVVKDSRVTIKASNMPTGEVITVFMGDFGTAGVNGIEITRISSGSGGEFSASYNIPPALYGNQKIAIRMETSSGFYAYNWFYNN